MPDESYIEYGNLEDGVEHYTSDDNTQSDNLSSLQEDTIDSQLDDLDREVNHTLNDAELAESQEAQDLEVSYLDEELGFSIDNDQTDDDDDDDYDF